MFSFSPFLFIGFTSQEYAVLTEDLIEEQQEILARFGSTPEAAQSRAELQSLSVKLGM